MADITIKSLLSSLDKMGKALLQGYFRSEMTNGSYNAESNSFTYPSEDEAAQKAWDRMKDHYESTDSGSYRMKTGHSFDPVSGSWTVDIPKNVTVDASHVFFDTDEVRGFTEIGGVDFSGEKKSTWHPIAMAGTWKHPRHGDVKITHADLMALANNFDNKILGQDVPVDEGEGHEVSKDGAYGWLEQVKVVGDELVGLIQWTDLGVDAVSNERYRYVSPRLYVDGRTKIDTATGKKLENVLASVSLTNHPIFSGQPKLTVDMSEYSSEDTDVETNTPQEEGQEMPAAVEEDVGVDVGDADEEEELVDEPDIEEDEEDVDEDDECDECDEGAGMSQVDSRLARMEQELAQMKTERDASVTAARKAELGGLTFSQSVVRTVDGQPRPIKVRQRFSPATVDLCSRIIAELGDSSDLAVEFSTAIKRGGFEMISLEDEVGIGFSSSAGDDMTWVDNLPYTDVTKTEIKDRAAKDKISIRQAHDIVMTPRV
jgi:hypothetical protein